MLASASVGLVLAIDSLRLPDCTIVLAISSLGLSTVVLAIVSQGLPNCNVSYCFPKTTWL